MRASVHPFAPFGRERLLQVALRLRRPTQRRAGRSALVQPQCVLAEHSLTPIIDESGKPFVQHALGLRRPAGAQLGGTGFEPDKPIPRVSLAQDGELLQRVVIPPFTVVQKDEGEAGILLVVSAVDGRFFDHLEAAFLAAAEADDISHPPERRRQRRHDVTVRADDQAGVLAARIELQHLFMFVVRLARRAERAEDAAFDRRAVRRAKADSGAQLIVRVSVARIYGDSLARDRERSLDGIGERLRGFRRRGRARADGLRHAAQIIVDRHVAAAERDAQP